MIFLPDNTAYTIFDASLPGCPALELDQFEDLAEDGSASPDSLPEGGKRSSKENKPLPAKLDMQYLYSWFRVLSASIVVKRMFFYTLYLDFSEGNVLRNAVRLARDVPIYSNHDRDVNRWLGKTITSKWAEEINGRSVAGIHSHFRLWTGITPDDAYRSERHYLMAEGVRQEVISRVSSGVLYKYRKSHPDMDESTFYRMMGKKVEGELVRLIATGIKSFVEFSLVQMGADGDAERERSLAMETASSLSIPVLAYFDKDRGYTLFNEHPLFPGADLIRDAHLEEGTSPIMEDSFMFDKDGKKVNPPQGAEEGLEAEGEKGKIEGEDTSTLDNSGEPEKKPEDLDTGADTSDTDLDGDKGEGSGEPEKKPTSQGSTTTFAIPEISFSMETLPAEVQEHILELTTRLQVSQEGYRKLCDKYTQTLATATRLEQAHQEILAESSGYKEQISQVEEERKTLTEESLQNAPWVALGKEYLSFLQDETERTYLLYCEMVKLDPEKAVSSEEQAAMITQIKAESTDVAALKELRSTFSTQVSVGFPGERQSKVPENGHKKITAPLQTGALGNNLDYLYKE